MPRRRTKWVYYEKYEDAPLYEGCVRLNPAAAKMWPHWPNRDSRYQLWKKCLYTKKGVCRRCGVSRARVEEMKDQGRPWEKPLYITPIKGD